MALYETDDPTGKRKKIEANQERSTPYSPPGGFFPGVGTNLGKITPVGTYTSSRLLEPTEPGYQTKKFEGPAPTYAPQKFTAPKYDKRSIAGKAQKFAGASLRQLKQQLQKATSKRYDNPNVRSMTLRQALEGYGTGLGKIMQQAYGQAEQAYAQEYGRSFQEAQMNFQEQQRKAQYEYQSAYNKWAEGNTVSDTTASSTPAKTPLKTSLKTSQFTPTIRY